MCCRSALIALMSGAQIDPRNDWDWTPLHFAATFRHPGVVDVLLAHGADVQARNKSGLTPLREMSRDARMEALVKKYGARR